MRLILVDDLRAQRWSPFAETRPVGELRFGAFLLRERAERWWGMPVDGYLRWDDPRLADFDEPGSPPVVEPGAPLAPGTLLWLSRAAPALSTPAPPLPRDAARVFVMAGTVVGVWLPSADTLEATLTAAAPGSPLADGGEAVELEGNLLQWPWELVHANAGALAADLEHRFPGADDPLPPGVLREGPPGVSLGAGARVGPGVVLDTRGGPIRLEAGVTVEGPCRLTGPVHLGEGTAVRGGRISRVSAGPGCRLGGEVDTAVLLGYANKAHEGYLGHALVGRWVNLGALTTGSDLRNDYRPVRVGIPGGPQDSGLLKVGVFLGDHVRTGIGTLLNSGTVVGAGSALFGGGMAPKSVPPFTWAGPGEASVYRWESFLDTARTVVARRDQPWTPGVERILRRLHETAHGEPR